MLRSLRALVGQPDRPLPPVVCVLTHIDAVSKGLAGEAVAAVAADLGLSPDEVARRAPVGAAWRTWREFFRRFSPRRRKRSV